MYPALAYDIAKARQDELLRQAEQAALAGIARRARLAAAPPDVSPAAGLARRALVMLTAFARSVHGRSRASAACHRPAPCACCA